MHDLDATYGSLLAFRSLWFERKSTAACIMLHSSLHVHGKNKDLMVRCFSEDCAHRLQSVHYATAMTKRKLLDTSRRLWRRRQAHSARAKYAAHVAIERGLIKIHARDKPLIRIRNVEHAHMHTALVPKLLSPLSPALFRRYKKPCARLVCRPPAPKRAVVPQRCRAVEKEPSGAACLHALSSNSRLRAACRGNLRFEGACIMLPIGPWRIFCRIGFAWLKANRYLPCAQHWQIWQLWVRREAERPQAASSACCLPCARILQAMLAVLGQKG